MHENHFHLSLFVELVPCPACFLILNQGTLAFTMRLDPVVFERLGHGYINKTPKEVFVVMRFANGEPFAKQTKTNVRRFRSFFGTSPEICSDLWELLVMADQIPDYAKPEHLLWSLLFLKVYGTEASLTSMVDCPDEKTFRKWVKIFVTGISWLESDIVSEMTHVHNCLCYS